jgi:hypothetical protein
VNQAIEAWLSGFVSMIGLAIIFVIGWLAFKAFDFVFDASKPKAKAMNEPTPKRTTGIVEKPFSRELEAPSSTSKRSPIEQSHVAKSTPSSHESNLTRNKKIAIAIVILALIFVPTLSCSRGSCITSGWEFIFSFHYDDRIDMQRMIIQLAVAGIICWLLVRKTN